MCGHQADFVTTDLERGPFDLLCSNLHSNLHTSHRIQAIRICTVLNDTYNNYFVLYIIYFIELSMSSLRRCEWQVNVTVT